MAIAPHLLEQPPAGLTGLTDGELAEVIELNPLPTERGFSYQEEGSRSVPWRLAQTIGHAAASARTFAWEMVVPSCDIEIRQIAAPHKGHDDLYLVTEPDPASGVNPAEADNIVIDLGLTEFADVGSGPGLHKAFAKRNPDSRIITIVDDTMSRAGQTAPASKAGARWLEATAADKLKTLPWLTRDGILKLVGVSKGSVEMTLLDGLNLAANPKDQLKVEKLILLSAAVFACNIDASENFRGAIDERELLQQGDRSFKRHLLPNALHMTRRHPASMLAAAPILGEYLAYPEKLLSRKRATEADYRAVKAGVDIRTLKAIRDDHGFLVVLAELDPLTEHQKPQWEYLDATSPEADHVQVRIVPDEGHLWTANGDKAADEVAQMELNQTA
jgi:hypothetical protein